MKTKTEINAMIKVLNSEIERYEEKMKEFSDRGQDNEFIKNIIEIYKGKVNVLEWIMR